METRLVRQCTAEFQVEKGYPKWLPETDTQEEPVIGSRYKRYKHKNRHKPIIDKVSSLNAISELYQITVSTEDPIAMNSITVRCNWSARVRSFVAGSLLGPIVGRNFPTGSDHNISQRCYRQHHSSLSLYVTVQILQRHTTTVRITGLYIVTCEHILC